MPTSNGHPKATGSKLTAAAVIVGILVVGAVTAFTIKQRSGGVTVDVKSGDNSFAFQVAEERIDFNELLNCLLSERLSGNCEKLLAKSAADDNSRRQMIRSILQNHGFYYIPSDGAVMALRALKDTEKTQAFSQSVRQLLYDLAGPFARPATFMDASDDRLLLALDDLAERKPSSPLVAKLWEMSLEAKGIFQPRNVNVVIQQDDSLKSQQAATCAGSVLLEKAALVVNEDISVSVLFSKPKACAATSTENVLAGQPTQIWLSEVDMESLSKGAASNDHKALKGIVFLAPSNFNPRDP